MSLIETLPESLSFLGVGQGEVETPPARVFPLLLLNTKDVRAKKIDNKEKMLERDFVPVHINQRIQITVFPRNTTPGC